MFIRPYRPADYSDCIQAFDSNCPGFFADDEKEEFQELLQSFAQAETAENASGVYYYVTETEGRIVACAGFYLPPDDSPATLVWGMVARDHHRKGIGDTLLKYRLNKIQELRPGTRVLLDTTQLSYGFFERSGFRVTKITTDFYAPGLDRYDMILDPEAVEGR